MGGRRGEAWLGWGEMGAIEEKSGILGRQAAGEWEMGWEMGKKHLLETPFGVMHAWVSGSPRPGRPALVTFPDVGHTHRTCFSELFGHEEMREIARSFHLVHLEPPGMEEGAPPYPPGYRPSRPPPTPIPLTQNDPE
uniref:Uncharacterized protein n=1 Tax=Malurus cyaneus samueli TaxID=2593467 RepID=A0A8C5TI65_9PASS